MIFISAVKRECGNLQWKWVGNFAEVDRHTEPGRYIPGRKDLRAMDISVRDFLSKACSKDEVAIHDCNAGGDQKAQHMAVMTARECFGDWIVDMFNIGSDVYGHSKCLHLFIYQDW